MFYVQQMLFLSPSIETTVTLFETNLKKSAISVIFLLVIVSLDHTLI